MKERAALPQFPAWAVPRGVIAPRSRSLSTRETTFDDDSRALVEGASLPPAGTVPNCDEAAREARAPMELPTEVVMLDIRPRPAKTPPVDSAPPEIARFLEREETPVMSSSECQRGSFASVTGAGTYPPTGPSAVMYPPIGIVVTSTPARTDDDGTTEGRVVTPAIGPSVDPERPPLGIDG